MKTSITITRWSNTSPCQDAGKKTCGDCSLYIGKAKTLGKGETDLSAKTKGFRLQLGASLSFGKPALTVQVNLGIIKNLGKAPPVIAPRVCFK